MTARTVARVAPLAIDSKTADSKTASGAAPEKPVVRGILGRYWQDAWSDSAETRARLLRASSGHAERIDRFLALRRITPDTRDQFLKPRIRTCLPDPFSLCDMRKAVKRIADAIARREKIAILSDYDVDGATSASILSRFLAHFGIQPDVTIPDRLTESYGPSIARFDSLIDAGATLIITLDCGASAPEPIAHARTRQVDVIVIDHHPTRNPSHLQGLCHSHVNPNRADDSTGLGDLCAAGVTFLVLIALRQHMKTDPALTPACAPNLLDYTDHVALGTVCDVVPLRGLNRAFVSTGLQVARTSPSPGLRALLETAAGVQPNGQCEGQLCESDVAFQIGPRINAASRMGEPMAAFNLLRETEPSAARTAARRLDRLNEERKSLQQDVLGAIPRHLCEGSDSAIVVAGDDWHRGVLGPVASRLTDLFGKPAIVISFAAQDQQKNAGSGGQMGTGSARSLPGFDMGEALNAAFRKGILVSGGGHRMAGGLTIARDRIGEFREHINASLQHLTSGKGLPPQVNRFEASLTADAATAEFLTDIERLGPFGAENSRPLFRFVDHRLLHPEAVGTDHVRGKLQSRTGTKIRFIAFSALTVAGGAHFLTLHNQRIDAFARIVRDSWRGRRAVQLELVDLVRHEAATPHSSSGI